MRWLLSVLLVAVAGGEALAYTFGGFDPDETEYLKRGPDDLVCAPAPPRECRAVDKKTARGYVKPARSRKLGAAPLVVTVEGEERIRLAAGERELGVFAAGARVVAVNANVFVSPSGRLIAVEYEVQGQGQGKETDVVVFEVAAREQKPVALPRRAAAGDRSAYERLLGKGGVWEQRLVACDQAGVSLTLKKTRRFALRITTKCQGRKDVTDLDGTYVTEGSDTLVLELENEGGPLERLECRLAACEDVPEDCLTCVEDDVSFTLQVVRR